MEDAVHVHSEMDESSKEDALAKNDKVLITQNN